MRECRQLGVCQFRNCNDCAVSGMRVVQKSAAQWGLSVSVPGVLHTSGDDGASRQAPGVSIARSHRALSAESWPGASAGVRRPSSWETPLSLAEVAHAVQEGVL